MYTFNLSTQKETKAGRSLWLWGQLCLQSEFQTSQGYKLRPCLKQSKPKDKFLKVLLGCFGMYILVKVSQSCTVSCLSIATVFLIAHLSPHAVTKLWFFSSIFVHFISSTCLAFLLFLRFMPEKIQVYYWPICFLLYEVIHSWIFSLENTCI